MHIRTKKSRLYIFLFILAAIFVSTGANVRAQETAALAAPVVEDIHYSTDELQSMLASIALYPDELLTQVLMASTYPLEVVQADRWVQENKSLKGDALKTELANKNWDDSVKALVSTPDVLATMSKNLDWTQKLGDAVLAQQDDVMDAVQTLRSKAYAENTLTTNDQQTVNVQTGPTQQTIVIESTTPNTVYVPYYNPTTVYGAWAYPTYPPVYYPPPPGYGIAAGFATGIAFAAGVAVFDDWWDDDFDWDNNDIDIDIDNDINVNKTDIKNKINANRDGRREDRAGQKWKHDPSHRRGVPYDNKKLDRKYTPERAARAKTAPTREQFRGRLEQTPRAVNNGQTRRTPQTGNQRPTQQIANQRQSQQRGVQTRTTPRNTQATRPQNNRPNFDSGNRSNSRARNNAFSDVNKGRSVQRQSNRGQASVNRSGGGARAGGGRGGGGGGRGGGRR